MTRGLAATDGEMQLTAFWSWLGKLVRDEIVKWLVRVLLIGGCVVLAIYLYREHDRVPTSSWVLGCILAATVAFMMGRGLYRRYSFRTYSYPRMKHPYEILHKKIDYRIAPDGLHFSRTVRIRSRIDGLESYQDKYLWTGGEAALPTPGAGCTNVTQVVKAGIWTFFSTQLDRSINRGQEHEFSVVWPVLSNWPHSSPFVSSSTDEPTRKLTFALDLSGSHTEGKLIEEQLRSIESPSAFHYEERELDNGRYTWNITRPRLYRHYRLRWSWVGQAEPQALPTPGE